MRKDEFLKQLGELKHNFRSYEDKIYERKLGFDECKEQVLKLALNLDVDGMSMESFQILRQMLNETAQIYGDLIATQKQLFDARNEITRLQNEIINRSELNEEEREC